MTKTVDADWPPGLVGELDHRRLKAPSIKLRSARKGAGGDVVYAVDLRVRHPNADEYLSLTDMHSLEHFLLEGFQRLLPGSFLSVGLMGCRTGFYLGFLNEGRPAVLGDALAHILSGIQTATEVPYVNIEQCGNFRDHSLEGARRLAREILSRREGWLNAAE